MPRVGNKHYSYDAEGRRKAKAASRKTGKPMTYAKPAKKAAPKRRPTRGR